MRTKGIVPAAAAAAAAVAVAVADWVAPKTEGYIRHATLRHTSTEWLSG